MSDDTVRHQGWDGSPAATCDWVACSAKPVLFADMLALDADGNHFEYGAEAWLCVHHLAQLVEQARAILVVNGAVEPATTLERNIVTTIEEHLP